jgi:hypothetical protein
MRVIVPNDDKKTLCINNVCCRIWIWIWFGFWDCDGILFSVWVSVSDIILFILGFSFGFAFLIIDANS